MILRSIASLILLAILIILYGIANIYGVLNFLLWNHKIFKTLWHGKNLPSSYDSGWGIYAFVLDVREVLVAPWGGWKS